MSAQERGCWTGLRINGAEAAITEDERFWTTLAMFAANRPRPSPQWDAKGTVEFSFHVPARHLRLHAIVRIQAAVRGYLVRRAARARHLTQADADF